MKAVVNDGQCRLIAEKFMPLKFRESMLKRDFLTFPADTETRLRAILFSSAICHQTYSLFNKEKNLKGWDFLESVYTELMKQNSLFMDPVYLSGQQDKELAERLRELFTIDGECTLDRREERAGFLIDISRLLVHKYSARVENLLAASGGFLINNGHGLYELLEEFYPFSDPLKKKSSLVVKFATESGIWMPRDMENFVPIMDYHMQRVLLRTGCIEVLDKGMKESLLTKKPVDSDDEIRIAAIDAVKKLSSFSGRNLMELERFLWSLGRSCCNEKTLCTDGLCNRTPCTFFAFVEQKSHEKCVLEGVCKGNLNDEYRRYWQPMLETHFY